MRSIIILFCLSISSCIGTDIIERTVPERVVITNAPDEIRLGDSYTFMADYFDHTGVRSIADFSWSSSNENILSINTNGLATTQAEGEAIITVNAGNARDAVTVIVGEQTITSPGFRTGSFMGLNDYTVEGMFTLENVGDQLMLNFAEDFQATNGPGLFIYLTPSADNVDGGIELGALISTEGEQSYEVPDEVTIDTYDYVLVYCKPFGVPFGLGTFEE